MLQKEAAKAPQRAKEVALIEKFVGVYCRKQHKTWAGLCPTCAELRAYAREKLDLCPYNPKPACRRCPTHCYDAEHRAEIRQVMRFSGMHFVKRGRIDWLVKYFWLSKVIDRNKLYRWRKRLSASLPPLSER